MVNLRQATLLTPTAGVSHCLATVYNGRTYGKRVRRFMAPARGQGWSCAGAIGGATREEDRVLPGHRSLVVLVQPLFDYFLLVAGALLDFADELLQIALGFH